MNAAAYRLEPADALAPAEVADLRRIFEDGFAPHLRADFASLTTGREPGEAALALLDGPRSRGFVMLRPLGETGWTFLRYLVAGQRGQGLGGVMWDLLMARLRAEGRSLLVWDAEDPDEPGCDPAEVAIRNRRIVFYQRHGGVLLPVLGYVNPHGDDGHEDWTPMRLMAAAVPPGAPAPGPAETPAIVAAVYRYRWRLDPGHPRVVATKITAGAAGTSGTGGPGGPGQPAAGEQERR